jgi:hypothetical protein
MFSFENGPEIETAPNAYLNFSEIPLTYGIMPNRPSKVEVQGLVFVAHHLYIHTYGIMTVPRYTVPEGRFLVNGFIMESRNSSGIHYASDHVLCFQFRCWNSSNLVIWPLLGWPNYEWLPLLHDVDGWTWSAYNGQYEYVSSILSWSILDPTSRPKCPWMEGNHLFQLPLCLTVKKLL